MSDAGAVPRQRVRVRKILFPSDLSAESDRAFPHARFVRQWLRSRLILYHAVETPQHHPEGLWERAEELQQRAEESARKHLQGLADTVDADCEIVVETAPSAHRALVSYINENDVDLAIMATHGREGLAHLLLGSVAEKVVQHADCSVLCVREPEHGVHIPYRKLLVPSDLSEAATRSFPLAAKLGRRFQSKIVALHVPRGHEAAESAGKERLTQALGDHFDGLTIEPHIGSGTPWRAIVELARARRVDLIAMSTQGHDSLSDTLLGSTTERVVRHAPCPVLVTHAEIDEHDVEHDVD